MKKSVFVCLLFLISVSALSQKVNIEVVRSAAAEEYQWQILDDSFRIVFQGGYYENDSVTFSLESEKRYYFSVSLERSYPGDIALFSLLIDNEPVILIKSGVGSGDHFLPFFTGVRKRETKITGGTTAPISEFPWQVYILTGDFRCGGAIIGPDWILTAAHCTRDASGNPIPASQITVKVGANNPFNSAEGQTYSVSEVIVNEGYDDESLENDIALFRLSQRIDNINAAPIRLITSTDVAFGATDPGVMTWVTGWGLTQVNPNVFPTSLQKVQLPIITNSQASTVWNDIPSTDIMAGYLNGNKDACNGDSGGPMVVQVLGENKLAGVVSWGSAKCNTYGAYTRVSLFGEWIRSRTGIEQLFVPPAPSGDTLICQGITSGRYSVSAVSGATSYEWRLSPQTAGSVSGGSNTVTVNWNTGFTGKSTLIYRVNRSGVVSDWSRLNINVVNNTRILTQSNDTAVCAGQPVSIRVNALGYRLVYLWYKNGTIIQSGPSPRLDINPATLNSAGEYSVEVRGYCGTVTSTRISLIVYPLTDIISASSDVRIPFGSEVVLDVNSRGHNLTYQWIKDGDVISTSSSPQLILQSVNAADIGLYRVTVSGTCGSETSDSLYLYVVGESFSGGPEVFLWPSVTRSEFNVAISTDDLYNLQIFNMMGQILRSYTRLRHQTTINISMMPKGTYIINVFNRNFRKSLKIIKY